MSNDQPHTAEKRSMPLDEQHVRAVLRSTIVRIAGEGADAIILFGSRARGDFSDDSDWDILILATNDADVDGFRFALHRALTEAAVALGTKVQPHIMRWSDIDPYSLLIRNIAEEGVPL